MARWPLHWRTCHLLPACQSMELHYSSSTGTRTTIGARI
ncbi:hypothetical protein LINGRAPRIM_LOCUS2596 [Linum grandiflorum]